MTLDLADYPTQARAAVRAFWGNRDTARQKQLESGKADQGERAGVTSGKNMDGFLALIQNIVRLNGLERADLCLKRRVLTLPGYFRPTKLWDMLVIIPAGPRTAAARNLPRTPPDPYRLASARANLLH